ncbi:MAG: hypothetical protein R3E48_00095 [Burkholderiaceae bacterium]
MGRDDGHRDGVEQGFRIRVVANHRAQLGGAAPTRLGFARPMRARDQRLVDEHRNRIEHGSLAASTLQHAEDPEPGLLLSVPLKRKCPLAAGTP